MAYLETQNELKTQYTDRMDILNDQLAKINEAIDDAKDQNWWDFAGSAIVDIANS